MEKLAARDLVLLFAVIEKIDHPLDKQYLLFSTYATRRDKLLDLQSS